MNKEEYEDEYDEEYEDKRVLKSYSTLRNPSFGLVLGIVGGIVLLLLIIFGMYYMYTKKPKDLDEGYLSYYGDIDAKYDKHDLGDDIY